jgi:hypothetical protein
MLSASQTASVALIIVIAVPSEEPFYPSVKLLMLHSAGGFFHLLAFLQPQAYGRLK